MISLVMADMDMVGDMTHMVDMTPTGIRTEQLIIICPETARTVFLSQVSHRLSTNNKFRTFSAKLEPFL